LQINISEYERLRKEIQELQLEAVQKGLPKIDGQNCTL
jgi:hypothetical protein